jgi:hypothetical protein
VAAISSSLERKALEIAKSEFKGKEFLTVEMWEKLKPKWTFRLPKLKTFHVLKSLMEAGHLTGRKEYQPKWGWSGTAYQWIWKA